jgi:hypothetical protein
MENPPWFEVEVKAWVKVQASGLKDAKAKAEVLMRRAVDDLDQEKGIRSVGYCSGKVIPEQIPLPDQGEEDQVGS